MGSFRDFIKPHSFSFSLREAEGEAPPPSDPEGGDSTTNKHHFTRLKKELGIEDGDFDSALEGDIQVLYKVPDYDFGFEVQPPVPAMVTPLENGKYEVTFLFSLKKAIDPHAFVGYEDGEEEPYDYEGEIEDQTEVMDEEELIDLLTPPYEGGGMGMGGPPMGGDPMGGGMGGPPMGAPPMGGPAPPGGPPMMRRA
jgi:hypothetical protein